MIHAEYLGGNPLTGRKVWLVRHINGRKFGDPWDWSVVLVKAHRYSRTALVKGALELNTYQAHKSLQEFLAGMGFVRAEAVRRNGVVKRYCLVRIKQQIDGTELPAPTGASGN
jgi:hypothetical protein